MAYYQVNLNGKYAGQDIVNVLWYRDILATVEAGEFFDLLSAIGATVKDQVWASQSPLHIRGFGMAECLPTGYTLETIAVTAYEAAFSLINSDPVVTEVNEQGLAAGESNGPTTCAIFRANLEPAFGPGFGLPKSGYLAFGPLLDAAVDSTGHLTTPSRGQFGLLGDNFATDIITALPPTILFPIRVRVSRIAGVVTHIAYKDVSDFVVRSLVSTRRSRQSEA